MESSWVGLMASHSMETAKVTRKVMSMERRMLDPEMGSSLGLALLVKM